MNSMVLTKLKLFSLQVGRTDVKDFGIKMPCEVAAKSAIWK